MTPHGIQQFVTFSIGKFLFGIDVCSVQEILREQKMTPVPLSSHTVKGLINLRGQIITAIELRDRLGISGNRESTQEPMNVIVRTSDETVSFIVDEIGDVLELKPDAFESTPENIAPKIRSVVEGVYKLPGKLLLVISPDHASDLTL